VAATVDNRSAGARSAGPGHAAHGASGLSGASAGPHSGQTGTPAPRVAFGTLGSGKSNAGGTSPNAATILNDRLKRLTGEGNVDYTPKRVAIGDAQSVFNDAMSAYEARLAPPPDILRRTFGYIYRPRTTSAPDSLTYVYDTYAIGPVTVCKAWKIEEHPYQAVREVGAIAGSAGIGGAVATSRNSPDVRHDNGGDPNISTVVFPCSVKSYTAIRPGSLTAPLPLHPDLAPARLASPIPAALGTPPPGTAATPAPARSLAP
jgi:hypothetical protein